VPDDDARTRGGDRPDGSSLRRRTREIAVDIAALGLEPPTALDATTSVLAGRLRARHYHRTTCAASMADCALAAAGQVTGEPVATSDPHVLDLCHDEGIPAISLPGSDGSVWSPA
jgi:hypothetical protein